MNLQKLVSIAAALLINVLVLGWFHSWTASVAAHAAQARSESIRTLPAIHVYPSAAQLRELGHQPAGVTTAGNRGNY